MLYYRFEVYDPNENAWYGLFSVYLLNDENMYKFLYSDCQSNFKRKMEVVNPRRYHVNYSKECHCYFTPKGLEEFKDDVKFMLNLYEQENIKTRMIACPQQQFKVPYEDQYQVVLADGEEI